MRLDRDEYFLRKAELTAKRSTCIRRSVGCILVNKLGHELATGYNGVPAGFLHCNGEKCEKNDKGEYKIIFPNACPGAYAASGTNLNGCWSPHAEQNALMQCSDVQEIETCYVTTSPCMTTCVKMLLNTGCRRIVFRVEYSQEGAKELWLYQSEKNREWIHLP